MSNEIAKEIIDRIKEEARGFIPQPAVARYDASVQGRDKVLWLTNIEGGSHVGVGSSFVGGVASVTSRSPKVLPALPGSSNVYKNTVLGDVLIKHAAGYHEFGADVGRRTIKLNSKTVYYPILEKWDATQVKMSVGGSEVLSIHSLREWIEQQLPVADNTAGDLTESLGAESDDQNLVEDYEAQMARLIEEEARIQREEEDELNRLIAEEAELKSAISEQEAKSFDSGYAEQLEELEKNRAEMDDVHARVIQLKTKRRDYIRSQAELRTQHILDPIQETVKRDHFFDGKYLIIEGGPGTGKTTTLIQRIKFLISRSILEYLELQGRSLTHSEKDVLFSNDNPWIFISPSQLLREYLARAMGDEGLAHLEGSVVDWHGHKRDLCRKYGIYRKGGFLEPLDRNLEGYSELYFYSDPARIRALENGLKSELLEKVSTILKRLEVLNFERPELHVIQRNIQMNALTFGYDSLTDCIKSYDLINLRYSEQLISIRDQGQKTLRDWTKVKMQNLASQLEIRSALEVIMEETADRSDFNWLERLNSSFETIIRKKAAEALGVEEHYTLREQKLLKTYPSLSDFSSRAETEMIAWSYVFATLGTGVNQNIFDEVIPVFRQYRRSNLYRSFVRAKSNRVLTIILEKNRAIHPDEEALILALVNRLMVDFRKASPRLSQSIQQSRKHPFQIGFEGAIKAVIAVDEVTDFSLMDIDCITSLKHPVINTVTFCGDLMQRMTMGGIKDWKELDSILSRRISATGSHCEVVPLRTSYRQSPSVLEVARTLFKDQQNRSAPFASSSAPNNFEPKPKLFISRDDEARITWAAEYIRSITEDYSDGVLPTIAVIVKNDAAVLELKTQLELEPAIQECGIPVEACDQGRTIGRRSSVRIFAIEYIKGLEFESVIFHDIDKLQSATNADLLGKFLYVGISRAAYHLAVTSSQTLPSNLSSIQGLFDVEED